MMIKFTKRCISIMMILILSVSFTNMQSRQQPDLTDSLVRYIGFYVFNYSKCKPPMFEKFRWIAINPLPNQDEDNPKTDNNGYTMIDGYIETIDDEQFKFKKASLKKNSEGNYENLEFETEKVNGIHFTFKGSFLTKSVNENGNYTRMRGSLLKYKNGKLIANIAMAPFSEYAEL